VYRKLILLSDYKGIYKFWLYKIFGDFLFDTRCCEAIPNIGMKIGMSFFISSHQTPPKPSFAPTTQNKIVVFFCFYKIPFYICPVIEITDVMLSNFINGYA